MAKYQSEDDLAANYDRDTRLQYAGWEVVHFSWKHLFADPAGVVARIRAAFERGLEPSARRRRESVPQPVTLASGAG